MKLMGMYCKAYLVKSLSEFNGWRDAVRYRKKVTRDDGAEAAERLLEEDDVLYVQEDYTVTDGIFIGENVVFDKVTDDWIEFCRSRLEFSLPVHESGNLDAKAAGKE